MQIDEIEHLVEIIRNARISELTVSSGGVEVRLRKPLSAAPPPAPARKPVVEPLPVVDATPASIGIDAPMVGIFHSIDSVGVAGETVRKGQIVGSIESMKLMNDILSDVDGTIAEVLVEDGMPVEYGQTLFRIERTV